MYVCLAVIVHDHDRTEEGATTIDVKLLQKGIPGVSEEFYITDHDALDVGPGQHCAFFTDILVHLGFSFQFDERVVEVVQAYTVLLSMPYACQFLKKGCVFEVVEVETAYVVSTVRTRVCIRL